MGNDNKLHEFLFVDGELVLLPHLTLEQTKLRREPKLALELYETTVQSPRAWTYGLQPAEREESEYNPCTS